MKTLKINEERIYLLLTDNESELFKKRIYEMRYKQSGSMEIERQLRENPVFNFDRDDFIKFLRNLYNLSLQHLNNSSINSFYEQEIRFCTEYIYNLHNSGVNVFYNLDKVEKNVNYHIYNRSYISIVLSNVLNKLGFKTSTDRSGNLPDSKEVKGHKQKSSHIGYTTVSYFDKDYADAVRKVGFINM